MSNLGVDAIWRLRVERGERAGADLVVPLRELRTIGAGEHADYMLPNSGLSDVHLTVKGEPDGVLATLDGRDTLLGPDARLSIGEISLQVGKLDVHASPAPMLLQLKWVLFAHLRSRKVGSLVFMHDGKRCEIFFRRGGIAAAHVSGEVVEDPLSWVRTVAAYPIGLQRSTTCLEPAGELLRWETIFGGDQEGRASDGGSRPWLLRVVTGPQRGVELLVTPPKTAILGAAAGADLLLDDPTVSARHLRLVGRETLEIEDLGSTNGTFVNGQLVTEGSLRAGDRLTVGHVVLVVTRLDGIPEPPSPSEPPSEALPKRHDARSFAPPGSLIEVPLLELLLGFEEAAATGTITLFGGEGTGAVSLRRGRIVGVRRPDVETDVGPAVRAMLTWTGSYMVDESYVEDLSEPVGIRDILDG